MKKYELNYNNNVKILDEIKKIILKRHPIVDDRLNILYPSSKDPRCPEMEIQFLFYKIDNKNITQILFLDGTSSYKSNIPEQIEINDLISKNILCDLISYLLTDHNLFENIYKYNTSIELPLIVDGRDENLHGISCGKIILKLDFNSHPDNELLMNEYLKVITTTFYEQLKRTNTFQKDLSNYCNNVKSEFINSLTTEELKQFINLLNNNDLCNLIYSMPNNRFIELYNKYNKEEKIKKLTKL